MALTKELNQRAKAVATTAAWVVCWGLFTVIDVGSAERLLRATEPGYFVEKEMRHGFVVRLLHFFWQTGKSSYQPVWPEMELGWRIVLGSVIGFFGAALGSVGGVGGGGIFVPMLTLIIGFDPKSSTAISKCMIMGAAGSTVYYNLRLRHPTLDMPLIDYDLALLFQPMLMLGISIGVTFNVMFADWMVTVLLIILFLGTSSKALFKAIETWKKETMMKKEAAKQLESESKALDVSGEEYKPLPSGPGASANEEVPLQYNIYWKELGLLVFVWVAFLAVQVMMTYTVTCSVKYWILNFLQVPIAVSVTLYEAICLYKGTRVIASKGKEITNWKAHMLFLYCCCGIVAGMVGGLLGLGGGFILGPLFLELGIPPQSKCPTKINAMQKRQMRLSAPSQPSNSLITDTNGYPNCDSNQQPNRIKLPSQVIENLTAISINDTQASNLTIPNDMFSSQLTNTVNFLTKLFRLAGGKCNINLCNGLLVFHVSCTILPSETFPSPICCLFCFSSYNCCLYWSACSEKSHSTTWKGIHNHLHTGSDNLCERDKFRRCGNSKYGREAGESRVHGV